MGRRIQIVPIDEIETKPAIMGRLKMGHFTGGRPVALDHWRLTSAHHRNLEPLAERYGGEVREFSHPKSSDRWELYTEADTLDVMLAADQAIDQAYTLFSGKGILRRCDGVTASVYESASQPPSEGECVCRAENALRCTPSTTLQVVLPEAPFAGVWVLNTKSELAFSDLRGSVTQILQLQAGANTPVMAKLSILPDIARGGARQFVRPQLSLTHSLVELLDGRGGIGELSSPTASSQVALPAPVVDDVVEVADEDVLPPEPVEVSADSDDHDDLTARAAVLGPQRVIRKAMLVDRANYETVSQIPLTTLVEVLNTLEGEDDE